MRVQLNRLKRISREVLWVGAGLGLGALGSLVGVRLLTSSLDPARYGELALGLTAASFAQLSVLQPLYEASLRFFAVAAEANQLSAFLAAVRRLTLDVTRALVIGSALIVLAIGLGSGRRWIGLAALSTLFCVLSGASVSISGIQNAARQRAIVAWHDTTSQWLRFALAVTLIAWLGPRSDVAMTGYVTACGAVLISQGWFLGRSPQIAQALATRPEQVEVATWEKHLRQFAWPIATWGIVVGLYMVSGRWSLQLFRSDRDVGLYAVVHQLGYYPVVMINTVMMAVVQPIMFGRAGTGEDPQRIARGRRLGLALMVVALVATVVATLIAWTWHEFIFSIAVAEDYRQVSYLLAPMVFGSGLFSCAQIASLMGMINPDTKRLIRPKVFTALIGIVLNFIGAWRWGLEGVIFSSVFYGIAYLLWVGTVVGLLQRHAGGTSASSAAAR